MDISNLSSKELQEIYNSGLALMVKKEVLSFDTESGEEVQQFIAVFIGEPGYIEALNSGAERWKPLSLIVTPKNEKVIDPDSEPDPAPKKAA